MSLTKEKVKWLMPPGVRGTAVSESDDYEGDDSDDELEEDEEEALIRRNRRRGRSSQRRSARQARRRSPSDPPVSHYMVFWKTVSLGPAYADTEMAHRSL